MFNNVLARMLTAPVSITKIKPDCYIDDIAATITYEYLEEEYISHWSYSGGFSVTNKFNDCRVKDHLIRALSGQTIVKNNQLQIL